MKILTLMLFKTDLLSLEQLFLSFFFLFLNHTNVSYIISSNEKLFWTPLTFIVGTYIFKYPKYTFKYFNIWNSYMRIIFSYYSDDISHSLIQYTMLHFLKVYCLFLQTRSANFHRPSLGKLWALFSKPFLKSIHCFSSSFFVFFLFHKHCIYYSTAGAIHYCVMVLGPLQPSSMALQLVLILAGESQDHRSSPPLLQMCLDQGKLTKRFVSFKTLM